MVSTQNGRYFKGAGITGGIALLFMPFVSGPGWAMPVSLLLFFTLPAGLRGCWELATSGVESEAIAATEGLATRHFWGGSGIAIAIDAEHAKLHLYMKPHYRVYDFADVRSWERIQQSGGEVASVNLASASQNIATSLRNQRESGLFIDVGDVELARWRIAFHPRKLEKELPRWMEILRQSIREQGA